MNNLWTPLAAVEIDELKAAKFSQTETSYITGLSPERLLTWHKLNFIPEPRSEKGRGLRRKYNFGQIAYLVAMRALSKRGVPLREAARLAEVLLVDRIKAAFDDICAAKSIDAAENAHPVTVVIYDLQEPEGQETYKFQIFWQGKPMDQPGESLLSWMYEECLSDAIVLAPGELALALRFEIEEVLGRRGDDAFRAELKDHLLSFKKTR